MTIVLSNMTNLLNTRVPILGWKKKNTQEIALLQDMAWSMEDLFIYLVKTLLFSAVHYPWFMRRKYARLVLYMNEGDLCKTRNRNNHINRKSLEL